MKIAAVEAIAALARVEASEVVAAAYGGAAPVFGPDYIIPKPFDPRLILEIAPAVARAAMDSGVARRPISDFAAYQRELERFVFRSGQLMRPVFEAAKQAPKRIVYGEGEDERVLRAVQTLVDDGIARADPARPARGDRAPRCATWACGSISTDGVRVLDPAQRRRRCSARWCRITSAWPAGAACRPRRRRDGLRTRPSVAAAMLLHAGQADAAICGGTGDWWRQMQYVLPIIPRRPERQPDLCAVLPDPAGRRAVHLRHAHGRRSDGGADRGDDAAGGRGGARFRHRAEGGAAVAFQFRRQRSASRRARCGTRWR